MQIIDGGQHTDNRGTIRFVNDFDMASIKRFYNIEVHDTQIVRGWQGHAYEKKYMFALKGSFIIGMVKIDNWENPSHNLKTTTINLKAGENKILIIEGGYANAIKALEPDSSLLVFSDKTTEESKHDDYRFFPDYWSL